MNVWGIFDVWPLELWSYLLQNVSNISIMCRINPEARSIRIFLLDLWNVLNSSAELLGNPHFPSCYIEVVEKESIKHFINVLHFGLSPVHLLGYTFESFSKDKIAVESIGDEWEVFVLVDFNVVVLEEILIEKWSHLFLEVFYILECLSFFGISVLSEFLN